MRLRLSLVEGQNSTAGDAVEHVFDERGGVIGRSSECSWRLECPSKLISRRHALVVFEDGEFRVYDASSNGLFHNGSNEPVGIGLSVPLRDGDTLRMGEFLIAVGLAGAPGAAKAESETGPRAGDAEPVEPAGHEPSAPLALDVETESPREPVAAARFTPATDLGGSTDQFQPPTAVIPEDWDLAVGSEAAGASSAVMPSLVESLGGQSDESGEALWSALRLEGAAASLTPELAADLGRCLRMSVLTVFRLKAALDQAEQRLGGSVVPAPSGAAGILDDYPDAGAYLAALLGAESAIKRQRLLAALGEALAALQARQTKLLKALTGSLTEVIEQFAPGQVEQHYTQFLADRGDETWFERFRRRWNPGAVYWGFYRSWYAGQQRSAFAALTQMLQKAMNGSGPARR